ncbi:MAG: DNA alkylation repair protein [Candidatus Cohnella colombiensis]|uniref:DNA alkylation repair protein n=1 Tax=Candidatus Cohnella colombiensis TaxID=3121368 RepID=A0AA95EZM5_9BACL|nr:MAG: DNA alkylation repair protein [Cohnella sp.]
MDKPIREQIIALADEEYRKFSAALIPTIDNILGVRLPLLRQLARNIVKGDWRKYLNDADCTYFEEVMLQGMVIGELKIDIEEVLSNVAHFVPKIDNWSTCDSFCSGLKIAKLNQERVWHFIQPYLLSEQQYELRFGIVMLLNYYVKENYIDDVLQRLDRIKHDGYYVKMAIAWAVSICFAKLPGRTMAYLNNNSLDEFTYHKALQKIVESQRVDRDVKVIIKGMRRR